MIRALLMSWRFFRRAWAERRHPIFVQVQITRIKVVRSLDELIDEEWKQIQGAEE